MAHCYKCRRKISFFAFWKASYEGYKKDQYKDPVPSFMQKFKCPYCGIETQQTYFSSYGTVASIIILIGGIGLLIKDGSKATIIGNIIFSFSFLAFSMIFNFLWWNNLSVLKKPEE
ncbi:MAG: hypothetical protein A2Y03_00975 [Omnitrophica WOR_2 bacterium GWF2_38_59]|nr:MAG: hypothetical protein A2Y06_00250 [Omnitrophica WOR_2 bacterium GWA2_37_7]OGX24015.1 MAG: hypothetical protein A2Y03_00975 [Omnitrophica WOR_2 bacterium GWF2_38_59]OGX46927.1 MAG: hypothetical protein A2243_12095 [Omnitrophica WOR_2 bacterium RIFOXYA2_FULL_38_17]OGX52465.1 MAG: hypothetical protein A2267_05235 [Omnitrophica WOR_2 bacterium RIFOXYA12_FULL_38_10]OGX56507.1 MAG: hypothetical protein A2447_10280 [Omnitrophica WOR_2 bacterium RIFOXYC2_FULL_38_12]OGX58395.1 MAG: hypothetical 